MSIREERINAAIVDLLDFNSYKWFRDDFPVLYGIVQSEIEKGTPKETILELCSGIEEVDEDLLNLVETTIDYLLRQRGALPYIASR